MECSAAFRPALYAQLGVRLDADVLKRTRDTKFAESFIGLETEVSKAASSINAATSLPAIEALATYGDSEKARFEEVDKQLTALKSSSQKEVLIALTGTVRRDAIVKGMGALRRTIEETVVKRVFKDVVPRWQDRVIVTGLRKVAWDHALVDEMVDTYEELSSYIEGHSHTDEAMGAPPEPKDLDE